MGFLYGRAGRLTAKNGGFRSAQWTGHCRRRGASTTSVRAASGSLRTISVFLCKSVFYGVFVWARRALNSQKWRFPARAVSLLREVVTFGAPHGQKSKADRLHKKDSFQMLYVAMLREYMDMEFREALVGKIRFEYNFEQVVDDFIVMCYLVGNDFLPPLPTVDIRDGGLDDMIKTYKDVLPTFDGYIIDAETCSIHPERFEILLAKLLWPAAVAQLQRQSESSYQDRNCGRQSHPFCMT